MVQEHHVLKCFSCETFQSHIVKKSNKWECKVCGSKQSVKKVYGQGSGKDCRIHTQKLNSLKGEKEHNGDVQEDMDLLHSELQETDQYNEFAYKGMPEYSMKSSKWNVFLEKNDCITQEKPNNFNSAFKNEIKRKRSFEIFESNLDGDYIDNTNSDFSFSKDMPPLKQTKKFKHNNITYKNNIASENNSLGGFETENKPPVSKLSYVDSKSVPTTVNLKWSKYLEPEKTQNICSLTTSSSNEEDKTVECKFDNGEVIERVGVCSQVNSYEPKICNTKECQSLPVFEQIGELTDSDFHLNF